MPQSPYTITVQASRARPARTVVVSIDLIKHLDDVLMPQLKNPHKPVFCPLCFLFYIRCLLLPGPHCEPTSAHLLAHRHNFFDACTAFLVAQRTEDDLPVLRRLLDDNKARCSTPDWHDPDAGADPLVYILEAVITFFLVRIRNSANKNWFKSNARKGTWPIAFEQLFPRGPLPSTAAYVFWCRTLISPLPIQFLQGLLGVARADVLPHLHVPPLKDQLIEALIVMLSGDRARAPPSFWTLQGGAMCTQETAAGFLSTVMNGRSAKIMDDIGLLCRGHEPELYPVLIAVLDSDIVKDESHLLTVASVATTCHRYLGLPDSTRHPHMLRYLAKVDLPSNVPLTIQLMYLTLHSQANSKQCAALGCSAPGNQACSRCQFVKYCGRACQRNDWKNGWPRPGHEGESFPHKEIWPILCRLFDAGLGVEGKTIRQFVDACEAVHVPLWEQGAISQWGNSADLIPKTVLIDVLNFTRSVPS